MSLKCFVISSGLRSLLDVSPKYFWFAICLWASLGSSSLLNTSLRKSLESLACKGTVLSPELENLEVSFPKRKRTRNYHPKSVGVNCFFACTQFLRFRWLKYDLPELFDMLCVWDSRLLWFILFVWEDSDNFEELDLLESQQSIFFRMYLLEELHSFI